MNTRMHAAVLHGPNDLRYETVPRPMLNSDSDARLVRINANGICGSDIHFFAEGKLGPFVVEQPYIPGHEAVGTLVDSGERVVIEPGIPCRTCSFCKRGLYNLCREVVFLSAPPVNGTFAEYVAHPEDLLFPVPDSLSDEEAAMVEPVSVGVHACNRSGLVPGAGVTIVGGGPIGLITLLTARAYGAGPVTVVDTEEKRRATAIELGAARVVDPTATPDTLSDDGNEFVFDATGSSAGCASALRMTGRGGVLTIIGWPEKPEFPFPVELIIEREIDVRGINRYRNTYPTAITLMSERRIDVRPLISHRFDFTDVVEAFRFTAQNRDTVIKAVVVNDR